MACRIGLSDRRRGPGLTSDLKTQLRNGPRLGTYIQPTGRQRPAHSDGGVPAEALSLVIASQSGPTKRPCRPTELHPARIFRRFPSVRRRRRRRPRTALTFIPAGKRQLGGRRCYNEFRVYRHQFPLPVPLLCMVRQSPLDDETSFIAMSPGRRPSPWFAIDDEQRIERKNLQRTEVLR